MIKVNDYEEIAFIRFVTKLEEAGSHQIEGLDIIEEYLLANCKKWDLKFFMKLFQDFLLRYENQNLAIEKVFSEFCYSSNSLECISPESLDKKPVLNKFLQV